MPAAAQIPGTPTTTRLWVPEQVLVTRSAAEQPYTAEILARCERRVTQIDLLRTTG